MKWLKKYEELKPYTYREAGKKLKSIGKFNRGQKLVDYGNLKKHGDFFNMWVVHYRTSGSYNGRFIFPSGDVDRVENVDIVKPLEFSVPSLSFNFLHNDDTDKPKDVEELCNRWFNGKGQLGFELECRFEPSGNSMSYRNFRKISVGYSSGVHLFTIRFNLARGGYYGDREYSDIFDKYQKQGSLTISIIKPPESNEQYYGTFADRKSANKFKQVLNKEIEKNYDKIFDIFSTVSADTDNFEKLLYAVQNIRVNYLYDDELKSTVERNLNKDADDLRVSAKWFGSDTNIGGVKPYKRHNYPQYDWIKYPKTGLPPEPEKDDLDDWEHDRPFVQDEEEDDNWSPVTNERDARINDLIKNEDEDELDKEV